MNIRKLSFCWVFIFIFIQVPGQSLEKLREKINSLVSPYDAVVGVAVSGINGKDTLTIHGSRRFPLQSVFKFHIALPVLAQVDNGTFSLDQKIKIHEDELLPGLYSPIREKYPKGGELPLSEIIRYTVAESDNVGCDLLLRLIGGPQVVENYFRQKNFKDLAIKLNEEVQQSHWDLQFRNWTTPAEANAVLAAFFYDEQKWLSPSSHEFIWKTMRETTTGANRLKGGLPAGTPLAHKTGSSGTGKDGVTAAVNDIGIVFLPGGKHFFISVFVTGSRESAAVNEKIIADIARVAYHYFQTQEGVQD